MTDQWENRKRAYRYIVEKSRQQNLELRYNSDRRVADVNYVSLDDLKRLKEGLSNPSQELVSTLKKLFSHIASEHETDEYQFTPFLTKT